MSGFYFIFNVGQQRGRTLEVGQGQSQTEITWSDSRTVGLRTDGTFYFALELPLIKQLHFSSYNGFSTHPPIQAIIINRDPPTQTDPTLPNRAPSNWFRPTGHPASIHNINFFGAVRAASYKNRLVLSHSTFFTIAFSPIYPPTPIFTVESILNLAFTSIHKFLYIHFLQLLLTLRNSDFN